MAKWISSPAGWLIFLPVWVCLTACGSGSSSGSSAAGVGDDPLTPQADLSGLSPSQISIQVEQNSSGATSLSFANSGDAALTYSFAEAHDWLQVSPASGSLTPGQTADVQISATCLLENLQGSMVLSSNDPDQGELAIPVSVTCLAPANFAIQKVTLNQAARGFDSSVSGDMNIPVLAGREMLVRVFVTGSNPVPDARVVVSQPGNVDQTFAMQAPLAIADMVGPDSSLDASHFAVLPGSALAANSTLRVEVGSGATVQRFPEAAGLDLQVVDPGPFQITFVPVTFAGATPTIDAQTYMREALQLLPIGEYDVEIRAPYVFGGSYDLDQLLTEMADLRDLDNSNRLYHGIIIPPGGATSGTAGIGYVGYPVSVSIDLGGAFYIIAHELGHNLDLGHAPGCGSPNPDLQYPHAEGGLGVWGFDVHSDSLIDPQGIRSDFMNYCNDSWVSDYHFDKALAHRDQSPIGFGPSVGEGLTVSGRISAAGQVSKIRMVPTQHHVAAHRRHPQAEAAYEFVAWDRHGVQIARQDFAALPIPDLDERRGFVFNIPAPTSAIDHYEIRQLGGGVMAASRLLPVNTAEQPVQVQWQGKRAQLQWQPQPGQVLVVRDAAGQVLTLDNSGDTQLDVVDGQLELSLVSGGRAGQVNRLRRGARGVSRLHM